MFWDCYNHCHQCILTSKLIYLFGYQVFTFYTENMNTDFENIHFFSNIFGVSIKFDCIKCEYLVLKWKNSFAKSVYIDDSDNEIKNECTTSNCNQRQHATINYLSKFSLNDWVELYTIYQNLQNKLYNLRDMEINNQFEHCYKLTFYIWSYLLHHASIIYAKYINYSYCFVLLYNLQRESQGTKGYWGKCIIIKARHWL